MFINTLPLRVDLGQHGARDALLATHRRLSTLLGHEQASLALAQRCSAVAAPTPLFNSLLNYRHSAVGDAAEIIPVAPGIDIVGAQERTDYPLTVSVDDLGEDFRLSVQALAEWGAQRLCELLEQTLASLVEALEHTPSLATQALVVLPAQERERLVHDFNATAQAYAQGRTVHALVEDQARRAPEAVALTQDGLALSYGELNRRANRLAHGLIARGVQRGDRVALCLPRSAERVIGLLAVLKAGAAYVPVDPNYPAERIAYLLADSAPSLVLADSRIAGLASNVPRLDLDQPGAYHQADTNPQVPGLNAQQLAYVVYTSGSTGQPKGVMIEHHALANLVHWHCQAFDVAAGTHTSSVAGFGFDAMAWEVWPALCAGATLHLPPVHIGNEHVDELLDWWLEQPLAVSFLPTPVAEQALRREHQHPTLRTLLIGGDRLRQFERDPGFAVINNYGPTETTVVATSGRVMPNGALDIGRPIANTRVYVLDEGLQPVPVGVTGELYIGGAQVARGYLNRPELTAERFLDDPFSDAPGARMYRSGDLVRWNADGTLDYLGRNDDQVKIRGVRVELGEVEAALAVQPGIGDAVALVRGERLLAWFTETAPVDLDSLRHALQAKLPAHLVPQAFMRLEQWPLTSHGKLDRRALPDPDPMALISQVYEAPQNDAEATMAAVWAEVLGVERVGRHDNFFELGGHSLLAVTLVERLRKAGLVIDVRVLFAQPTLAALAGAAGGSREVAVPANRVPDNAERITPDMLSLIELSQADIERIVATVPGGAGNVQEIYPLAPLQEGVLYHHLSAEHGDPYLLQTRLAFDSVERLLAWAGALQQVIDRHDILRTAVLWKGLAQPVQVVWRNAELAVIETDTLPDEPSLDLSQAPLTRLYYSLDPANHQVLAILLFHHLTLDHTAMDVVAGEMRALLFGQAQTLPAAVPYRNYVAQACLGDQAGHEAFFREMLGDVDEPTLPLGLADVQGDGRSIDTAFQALDVEVGLRLRSQARQLGVSAASLMHLAWARVLGVLANRRDVVFGTVLMGRLQGGEGADRALGMFINTLPLRVDTGAAVRSAVRATHRSLSALLGHEHAPLALAQRCSGVAVSSPLFSALLNYRHTADDAPREGEGIWAGVRLLGGQERSNYPLTLSVNDLGKGFSFNVLAVPGIGAQRVAQWMANAVVQLLQVLEQGLETAVDGLPILAGAERRQLLENFNPTAQVFPKGHTVHALVEAQALRAPEAVALTQDGLALSYGELNRRANRLAHGLIARGVQRGDRVALCLPRSAERIIGLLAVLKAGAAYVPVDPNYPAERIAYLLADSAPSLVLADSSIEGLAASVPRLDLDQLGAYHPADDNPQVPGLNAQQLAYVVYTSGSTGQPKGVMIEHHALANLVHWHCQAFDVAAGTHTASVAGFGFDAMAWEVWPALCAGATLHLPPVHIGNEHVDELLDWWLAQPLAVSFLPTPVAEQALRRERQHPTLRTLLIGGDRLRQFERDPGFAVINNYGPTETTVVATSGQILANGELHIGRPIANTRVYVLDESLQPVPVGVTGELYIGGVQVARGYLNRPELTAERFLDDPFSDAPGARMYRSGDLVRWNADGTLDYLGRNDDQVKIRGVRVELGEIEAALAAQPSIDDAVVLVRGEWLLAWFTETAPVDLNSLRQALQAKLPAHLVPQAFVRLEQWPLTSHGKLDRRALPDPDPTALLGQVYEAPQNDVEVTMAAVWAEVLGVERVGRHDNFFELGGHSLLAVTLIERLRQQELPTDVRVLFNQPTVAALAAALGQGRQVVVPENRIPAACSHITPDMLPLVTLSQADIDRIVATVPGGAANVQDIYPLAPLQEGILYHHLSALGDDPYLLQWRLAFDSQARLHAFASALDQVIARHDILRTAVLWDSLPQPLQVVLRNVPSVVSAGAVLDLSTAPLIRLLYTQATSASQIEATLQFHHIALDQTAMKVVLEEIRDHLHGQTPQHPPVPFRNYVAQTRLGDQASHEAFFREMLGDVDEPTLPLGFADIQGDGRSIDTAHQVLDGEVGLRLRSQARQLGVSAASLMHLAWARVLGVLANRRDVVFGSVLLGRMSAGAGGDRALGMFINTLPLRVDTGACAREAVHATHRSLSALLGHEHAPLTLAQRCSGVAVSSPLFSALLNYRHSADDAPREGEGILAGVHLLGGQERSNYPLTLSVNDQGKGFSFSVLAVPGIGAQRVARWMANAVVQLLLVLEQGLETAVDCLPILDGDERRQLLENFNPTAQAFPKGHTVHALVEAQALRAPEAVALTQDGLALSYGELNRRANRLAHGLIERGVQLGDRVALCLPRSAERVIGLLAVLKAGAAYVPVDPNYPAERIAYLLADSAPTLVLADSCIDGLANNVPRLDLDQPGAYHQADTNPQVPGLNAQQLAYVVYTSGSTGQPKGVMIEHHALANLVHWHCQAFEVTAGTHTASVAGFGFDAMAWEVWPALCAGATLHLPPVHIGNEHVDELLDWWLEQPLAVSFLPTPVAEQALRRERQHPTLRILLIGGDRLRQFERDPGFAVINNYGPTETTVVATSGQILANGPLHIGRPIANTRVYVLDEGLQPVPVGVTGELYIGGAQVARGYLNRPELTAERFLDDPFSDAPGARMYRSGDLVRWNADGTLDYLGRNDDQVKIRGVRVELGEIEAALAVQPGIGDAVALVRGERLLAWFTETAPVDLDSLRHALQAKLPAHLVPQAFMRLEQWPLTSHGKLDRRALPDPDPAALLGQAYEAPQNDAEATMAAVWAEVLGVERVGRHDNFFELGGHSLLAVSLTARLRLEGLQIDVRTLFGQPTVAALAATLGNDRQVTVPENRIPDACTRITPDMLSLIELDQTAIARIVASVAGGAANIQDIYPLAPLQEGVLYHHLRAPEHDPYVLYSRLKFDSLERLQRFAAALDRVIARHDVLRTVVLWDSLPQPLQVVLRNVPSVVESGLVGAGLPRDSSTSPMDLSTAPLIRLFHTQVPGATHIEATLQFHHIVLDHTALEVVGEELNAYLQGAAAPAHAPVPYRNYVAQARLGISQAEHEAFFREQLADIDEPTLAYGLSDVQGDGCNLQEVKVQLSTELAAGLRRQARQLGISVASLFHLAWARLLGAASGKHSVVFGTVLLGRLQGGEGAERALGMFINTLPLRVDLAGVSLYDAAHAPTSASARC
ncbi:non-ribosomal peptide synthetase [Pseudomonas rubra]|uniref:Amino acid adenylation domain-containing protein n=1 Tax=Pseudomonas rubra TaxID=2942627 RepID=A0ABT5P6W9_9PSED|nr:non-ribosomal peptide synthetase [Pseudomonas rubra]MDD1013907.1 amino acid adenylation domain-containing protein [Pseudomonas rubra]MDD1038272.1 amino acid adenylation domain-containing protein [Pseudomonas rubra]MDD1154638.1 amino acid adenylation domain-containing protein [Pseudomonas rubra]